MFGDIATTRSVNLWEAVAAGNAHAIQKEKGKALEARNEHGDTLLHLVHIQRVTAAVLTLNAGSGARPRGGCG